MKLLIVVDNEELMEMLCAIFVGLGRKLCAKTFVIKTRGGVKAVQHLAERPDLMLTDNKVPIPGGKKTTAAARAISPDTAIVLIQNKDEPHDGLADTIIAMPIMRNSEIENAVTRLLGLTVPSMASIG